MHMPCTNLWTESFRNAVIKFYAIVYNCYSYYCSILYRLYSCIIQHTIVHNNSIKCTNMHTLLIPFFLSSKK